MSEAVSRPCRDRSRIRNHPCGAIRVLIFLGMRQFLVEGDARREGQTIIQLV